LVWQDGSEDRVDMWSAIYDPVVQVWSQPQKLTADDSMEYGMSPVFNADGDLIVSYDKTETVYETRIVNIGGEDIQIDNVPGFGQTDLYVLWHTVTGDQAVFTEDVTFDPENLVEGQNTTITANVQNLGDVPAVDLDVAFYNGDPGGSGILIDEITLPGTLVGGDSVDVEATWLVPAQTSLDDVYLIVDPYLEQEDYNRTNNTAIKSPIMKPDAVIDSLGMQQVGPYVILTTRVRNIGSVDISSIDVTLRQDSVGGPLLTTLLITDPIVPNAYMDVIWQWDTPALGTVYAIADEAGVLAEYREDNNTRFLIIRNLYDACRQHGDVDLSGVITAQDAQTAFLIVLALYTPTYEEECAADCNGDEVITAGDAQAIFLKVLGLGECVDLL